MTAAVRSMALSQNLHNIMQGSCGGLPTLQQKPLAVAQLNSVSGVSLLGKRPLAPAPPTSAGPHRAGPVKTAVSAGNGPTMSKKYAFCGLPYSTPQQSASVQRRNARERNRVKQVNNGFANLRQHIPSTVVTALTNGTRGANKKLSKVDTLRLAVEYIRSLQRMLDESDGEQLQQQHPQQQQQPSGVNSTSNQLTNASVCSASSGGSTYYGTMSEPSNASSPAPSHLSDHSSVHGGPAGYGPIGGGFKHEPYDIYVDPSSSPTPSFASDHGIGGVTSSSAGATHLHATTVLPGHTTSAVLGSGPDNNNYIIAQQHQQQQHQQHHHHHHHQQPFHPQQFKTELYDDSPYDEELSPQNPDDEELLDAISWWQQQ